MSSRRFKYSLIAVLFMLAVTLGAVAVSTAATGSTPQPTNKATLTLSVKAKKSLARQHVTVRALRPATRRKSSYALPAIANGASEPKSRRPCWPRWPRAATCGPASWASTTPCFRSSNVR